MKYVTAKELTFVEDHRHVVYPAGTPVERCVPADGDSEARYCVDRALALTRLGDGAFGAWVLNGVVRILRNAVDVKAE